MSEASTIEIPGRSTDLLAPVTTGLEPSTAASLRALFIPFLDKAQEWETRAKSIVVTSIDQKREMRFARESRLALREIRVAVENARKAAKADALSRGKAVDGIANAIKGVIEPLEAHLQEQEDFAKHYEAAEREKLRSARRETLVALGTDPSLYSDLGAMSDEAWAALLESCRLALEAKLEAARQADAVRVEAERIAAERREAERQALIAAEAERVVREQAQAEENARLRAEAEEREKAAAEERARVEAERTAEREKAQADAAARDAAAKAERERLEAEAKAAAEVARVEREKVEAEARKAREEADRAAAELAAEHARKDAAERAVVEKAAAAEAARAAAELAPDREKLIAFAATLRGLQLPTLATKRGKAAGAKVAEQLEKMATWIEKTGGSL